MRRLIIFIPIVIVLEYFLWNLPPELTYHNSQLVRGIAMFGTVFFFIPTFIYFSVSKLKSKNWAIIAIATIPINGFGFATTIQKREVDDLRQHGQITTGIVIEKSRAPKRYVNEWQVKSRFQVNNESVITEYRPDHKNIFTTGDSVEIVFLPKFPKVNRLSIELN